MQSRAKRRIRRHERSQKVFLTGNEGPTLARPIGEGTNAKIERFTHLLRSPVGGGPLDLRGSELVAAADANERYHLDDGGISFILRSNNGAPAYARPNAFVTTPVWAEIPLALHIGNATFATAGDDALCLETTLHPGADAIVDLAALPFADACAAVIYVAGALENVVDSRRAIAECKRVLRPGGLFYVDTAFMQSFRDGSTHRFNLSPLGAETLIAGAFELVHAAPSQGASVLVAIRSLLFRYLSYLRHDLAEALRSTSMRDFLEEIDRVEDSAHVLLASLSPYARRSMAAAFTIVARKPAAYDERLEANEDLFRYYRARTDVLFRAHEVDLYRRLANNADASRLPGDELATHIETKLAHLAPVHSENAYAAAADALETIARDLLALRDVHIASYISLPATAVRKSSEVSGDRDERPTIFETDRIRLRRGRYGYTLFNRRDDTIGRAVDLYGEWAQAECDLLASYIRPGDVVLDVGANIGTHTLFFSQAVGPEGRVLTFEPNHETFAIAAANVALNERTNVRLFPSGVGAAPGTLIARKAIFAPNNYGACVLAEPERDENPLDCSSVVSLDSLDLARCQLIKIDVEGMEIDVLRGANATITRHRPVLYLENTSADRSLPVCTWLLEHGYRIFWHAAPAYNTRNMAGNCENIFGDATELNVLCLPSERDTLPVPALQESFCAEQFGPGSFAAP